MKRLGEVMNILNGNLEKDMGMGITGRSPRRDQFRFISSDRDFARSAFTGRRRLLFLGSQNYTGSLILEVKGTEVLVAT